MGEKKKFCQRTKWLEAREAWISGDRGRAKEIEEEIFLYLNPWTWSKEKAGMAFEDAFGSKRELQIKENTHDDGMPAL